MNFSQKALRQKNTIAISMTEIGERDNDEDEVDGCTTTNNRQLGPNPRTADSSEYYMDKIRGESR